MAIGKLYRASRAKKTIIKKARRFRRKPTFVKRVRNVVMRTKETLKKTDFINESSLNTVSTSPSYYDAFMKVAQGTTYTSRQGHKIKSVGIKFKAVLYNNWTSPNWVRILCLINKRGSADTNYQTGALLFEGDSGNIDFSSCSGNQSLIQRINTESYTVLKDFVVKLGGDSTGDKLKKIQAWIPFKATLQYDASSAVAPSKNQVVFLAWALQGDTDVATGQTVEISATMDFYFKNL